jgi:hypothetical protein
MAKVLDDEWKIVESLLPAGWSDAARAAKAFRRARYTLEPSTLLRLILFHAVGGGGLRQTVAQAKAAGISSMSAVALFKRLKTSAPWLRWMAAALCRELLERPLLADGLRPRAIDATHVQGPGSVGTEWRLHYTLDLCTLSCDWHALTDGHTNESFALPPVRRGDVLIGDRAYLYAKGVRAVVHQGGDVLVRMRWSHVALVDERGQRFHALSRARKTVVGRVGQWSVQLPADDDGPAIAGRIVIVKLPKPIAERARYHIQRLAADKGKKLDPRSVEAAGYIMLFTTLPSALLDATGVADLYRFRWQIELAFKRHKQLLQLGRLPHQDADAAQSWILAKLVVALLLEKMYRIASAISPWGYRIKRPSPPRQTTTHAA